MYVVPKEKMESFDERYRFAKFDYLLVCQSEPEMIYNKTMLEDSIVEVPRFADRNAAALKRGHIYYIFVKDSGNVQGLIALYGLSDPEDAFF